MYLLNRTVTTTECPWLDTNMQEGSRVHAYDGCTYGCITAAGTACTDIENELPFYELPTDALTYYPEVHGYNEVNPITYPYQP